LEWDRLTYSRIEYSIYVHMRRIKQNDVNIIKVTSIP
jgi:hypothetical protein